MAESLRLLVDTSDFPDRWHCGNWTAPHAWTHILSDVTIFGAYFAIPVLLLWFCRRRKDVPFPPLFWLFAGFILFCGLTHLIEATLFWWPWYRLSAVVKLVTAVISWTCVAALIRVMPEALALPGMARLNEELRQEIRERGRAEQGLREIQDDLEKRTEELTGLNARLQGEVAERQRISDTLARQASEREARRLDLVQLSREAEAARKRAEENYASALRANEALQEEVRFREQTEADLRRMTAELRFVNDILEQTTQPFRVTDLEGRLVRFNRAFEGLTGYGGDELRRMTFWEFTPKRWHAAEQRQIADLVATGRAVRYEKELRRKDGSVVPVELVTDLYGGGEGGAEFFCSFLTDVSERKRAEEEKERLHQTERAARLRAEEAERERGEAMALLDTLFRTATVGLAFLDRDLRFVRVNDTLAGMNGLPAGEHLGRTLGEVIPHLAPVVEPLYYRVLRTGEPVRNLEVSGEGAGAPGPSGHWLVNSYPVHGPDGQVLGVGAVVLDITERKRSEQALEEAEARYHDLYDNAPDMYVSVDAATARILQCNQTLVLETGFAREELIGRLALELYHPDCQERARRAFEQFIGTGQVRGVELQLLRAAGGTIDVSLNVSAVRDADGRIVASRSIFRDIGARKRAEEEVRRLNAELEARVRERTAQLETANKELEAFSYSVSHDLRAPLRAIDGFSRIVLDNHAGSLPEEAREYLRDVRANTLQMGRLVDDLLALSRLGRAAMRMQSHAPAELVSQCLEDLRAEQQGRHVEVRVGELPTCRADPALLKRVWVNLLSNALKYTKKREHAVIEVGCRPGDAAGFHTYFVRDNGVGFDMRYAHKLFGVFQRLHRAEDYEGTGVGLAIVQRIIHRHGGEVWAEAEPDRGATFYFTLEEGGPNHD